MSQPSTATDRAGGPPTREERIARARRELVGACLWRLRRGLRGGAFAGKQIAEAFTELGGGADALAALEESAGDEGLDPLDREQVVIIVNDPAAREELQRARGHAFAVDDAAIRARIAEGRRP